jgi:aspartate kinase
MALHAMDIPAVSLTGAQAGSYRRRSYQSKDSEHHPRQVHALLDKGNVVIVAGFQARRPKGISRPLAAADRT